jgi:predicted HAD superfamily Cof-like phosphohydrolase
MTEHLKSETQKRIELFMRASGQTVNDRPAVPNRIDRILRAKLLWEETLETIEALGVVVRDFTDTPITKGCRDISFEDAGDNAVDLVEAIDGCIDVIVIATGTLSTLGVPDTPHQIEVDNANLRKIGPDGKCVIREDGKLLKPVGWTGPDHLRVLATVFRSSEGAA